MWPHLRHPGQPEAKHLANELQDVLQLPKVGKRLEVACFGPLLRMSPSGMRARPPRGRRRPRLPGTSSPHTLFGPSTGVGQVAQELCSAAARTGRRRSSKTCSGQRSGLSLRPCGIRTRPPRQPLAPAFCPTFLRSELLNQRGASALFILSMPPCSRALLGAASLLIAAAQPLRHTTRAPVRARFSSLKRKPMACRTVQARECRAAPPEASRLRGLCHERERHGRGLRMR